MKYWYLKGEDVLGPADVETIAKDETFSADMFVCPEPDSDKTDAWQSADQYMQDFGYILDPEHYSKPEPEPEPQNEPQPQAELQDEPEPGPQPQVQPQQNRESAPVKEPDLQAQKQSRPVEENIPQAQARQNFAPFRDNTVARANSDNKADIKAALSAQAAQEPQSQEAHAPADDQFTLHDEPVYVLQKPKNPYTQNSTVSQDGPQTFTSIAKDSLQEAILQSPKQPQPPNPKNQLKKENSAQIQSNLKPLDKETADKKQGNYQTKQISSDKDLPAIFPNKQDEIKQAINRENTNTTGNYAGQIPDISEETIHSRSPLNVPMDSNLLDEIPARAVLSVQEDDSSDIFQGNMLSDNEPRHIINSAGQTDDIFTDVSVPAHNIALSAQDKDTQTHLTDEEAFAKALEETKTDLQNLDNKKNVAPVSSVLQDDNQSLDTFTTSQPAIQINPNTQETKQILPSSVLAAQETKQPPQPGEALSKLQMPVIIPADTLRQPIKEPLVAPQRPAQDYNFSAIDNIFDSDEQEEDESPLGNNELSHSAIREDIRVDNGILSVQEDLNNQFIHVGPATTGKILHSSEDNPSKQKNKHNDLLYLMVMFMGVLIIVAVLMMFTPEDKQNKQTQPQPQKQTETQNISIPDPTANSVIQGIDEGIASPQLAQTTQQEREALKAEAYAENLVRKHKLKSNKTIEEYLSNMYDNAYQAKWGSNKLYGNAYVVEFFASKVRSEPIRYMFRVNVDNDTIEGMNNSTIDLLSK